MATQLVLVHRPPSDAVTIGAPLADPWWVGQGGRAELINYHHTGPMQSNALDQPIGSVDEHHPSGNSLVIDIGGGRHVMMGHLRQDSITVRSGDRVREGQPIARVGSSGHSSALRTYPLLFRDADLLRGGAETRPHAIDPRRGDIIRPIG